MYIIQRVIPHYRVALFQELYRRTGARVITAERPPAGTFLNFADPRDHDWALPAPFCFPDPQNAFRAQVPLELILSRYAPRCLVAEFGVRLSSTRDLARARRAGMLYRFAFWTHGWQMERGFSTAQDLFVQTLRVQLLRRADALGAYSEEGASWLRKRLPRMPVVTLGNALDPSAIVAAARAAKPIRSGSLQLLGVGRLTEDKRFDVLIELFRRLRERHPEVAVTIIGDGPHREALMSQAGPDVGRGVTFTGALHAEPELAPHFLGADLLIVPGAAGLAVNHALAYGVPVAAFTRGPGAPRHHPEIEYVVEGRSGILVNTPTVEAMASAISQAHQHGEVVRLKDALKRTSPAPSVADVVTKFEQLFGLLQDSSGNRRSEEQLL